MDLIGQPFSLALETILNHIDPSASLRPHELEETGDLGSYFNYWTGFRLETQSVLWSEENIVTWLTQNSSANVLWYTDSSVRRYLITFEEIVPQISSWQNQSRTRDVKLTILLQVVKSYYRMRRMDMMGEIKTIMSTVHEIHETAFSYFSHQTLVDGWCPFWSVWFISV